MDAQNLNDDFFAKQRSANDWVMPFVLLLVGMPMLLAALWMAGDEYLFRATAERVSGTVVERKGSTPVLVVEYASPAGKRQLESFGSDLYKDIDLGRQVDVFISPVHPDEAHLGLFVEGYLWPVILGVFGGFFGIPGLVVLRSTMAARRRANWSGSGMRVQAQVIDIQPVLDLRGFSKRRRTDGPMNCTILRENERWVMIVDGEELDPFDLNVKRDWGIQYRVVAQWRDAHTGQTQACTSDPVDTLSSLITEFRQVTVIIDPEDTRNCCVDLGNALPQLSELTPMS